MIDLGFAVFLAVICAGVGKRLLDAIRSTPEHPADALALALPLGMGVLSLAALALGEFGQLNLVGLSVLLAVMIELGFMTWIRSLVAIRGWGVKLRSGVTFSAPTVAVAICTIVAVCGTMLTAAGPVTDGDALCYHLQVPKVFLMRQAVGFLPDLHETVYPLLTEMLYAVALEFRGPVACRGIQWILGLLFAANVTALARPNLGGRAWWAGAIVLLAPAVSNGMSAPLNDVALAAFGSAAIFAWVGLHARPSVTAAVVGGMFAGFAIGVKYPALVLCSLLTLAIALRTVDRRSPLRQRWLVLALIYVVTTALVGGCWYLRAYIHTGNPVYPYFRHVFGNSGLDEVLDPSKRPLALTPWNLLLSLGHLSLEPDKFDSFSHQFGPVFLLFLPALLLERVPRRVLSLVGLGYAFLILCLTQRQSMRFVLIALGPMSVAVAYLANAWWNRRTVPSRAMVGFLLALLVFEASLAVVRSRHALQVVLGRESATDYLLKREPTYHVGRWAARHLPAAARLIGQDHRGFYIPRDYTMELAHRRRTGLGTRGESPQAVVDQLRESGFTHVMFCPPVPESTVEFDPTLGRILSHWLAERTPVFREELADGDGVVRRYAIYELSDERVLSQSTQDVLR